MCLMEEAWDACLRLQKKLSFLPHIPTMLLSLVFWWFYQVYACGYLAFVENSFTWQVIYSFLVCGGIGMTASSAYATTLQRYPLRPKKFAINCDFDRLTPDEREQLYESLIERTGANKYHAKKFCLTCQILMPERSHHCSICDVCSPRFDHHCVALHKCIHYKNQKQFALFFFWMCFSLAVAVISFNPYVWRAFHEMKYKPFVGMAGFMHDSIASYTWLYTNYLKAEWDAFRSVLVACLVLSSLLAYCLFIIFSVVFCGFMWFCVIRNGTILACNKAARFGGKSVVYFVDSKSGCFRKPTMIDNVKVIFGKNWRYWILPVPNSDTDGWLHDCNCKAVSC